jgi:hypothetical protein
MKIALLANSIEIPYQKLQKYKHIGVRFHFLRDLTKEGVVELKHCSTQEQLADIMTKALKLETFCKLREDLSMCDVIGVV